MTLHHANRGGILTDDVEQLLNEIARGNTREVFRKPAALQALLDFRLLTQDADRVFTMTPVGWKYVTCKRALAMHRLQDATPSPPMADSRLGFPGFPGGRFASSLFSGTTDRTDDE